MKNLLTSLLLLLLVATVTTVQAQGDIFGRWTTIDDATGEVKSVVDIYKKEGKAFGKIVKIFREEGEDPDPVCTECSGKRKGQKIIGMEIITGLEYDNKNNEWEDGDILDPENGKEYDCKIWVEEGKLKVRGYWAFFYRTQTWLKEQ